jgi:Flavin containing amine oxidoreductase
MQNYINMLQFGQLVVYMHSAIPGRSQYCPSQQTSILYFTLAGVYTSQKYFVSMEGALLGGKLAAEIIARCYSSSTTITNINKQNYTHYQEKEVSRPIVESTKSYFLNDPMGVKLTNAIDFGVCAVK